MGNHRLLLISVVLIGFGLIGIVTTTSFHDGGWASSMMGRGMMSENPMRNMMQRMMPEMLPSGIIPEELPDPNSKGAELLVYYCTQCHNLPSPSMHTAEEWPGIVSRMFRRMSMMSRMRGMGMMMSIEMPSPEDQQTILTYLQSHALKSISPHTLPSPESRGAVFFKEFCSQCHALPDPKLHTPKEWPAVVEKMRGFMQAMDKKAMTGSEEKEIVGYLESHAQK
jgi:cytochrome c2